MKMSSDLINQIASMLSGDPNVVNKPTNDPSACPISASDVEEPHVSEVVEMSCEPEEASASDDYGVPTGTTGSPADESTDASLQNCEHIHEYSKAICDIVGSGCQLDEWMQQKLTVCKTYISDIKHALEFKQKHSS
jgi:hypothetical protein